MTLIAFSGDQPRARQLYAGGQLLALLIGTGADCCNECEPCCPCTDISIPESCGALQSVVAVFSFGQLGTCQVPGPVTVTATAADQDNGFPFSKTVTAALGGGASLTVNVAFFCDGSANCYVLLCEISVAGCNFCNGNLQFSGFVHRLNGSNYEDGECCPAGNETSHTLPFCDDFSLTISSTLVY